MILRSEKERLILKNSLRIYLDTSVFGGYFDEEFMLSSRRLFSVILKGKIRVVISDVVGAELGGAPTEVQELAQSISKFTERAEITASALDLQKAYIKSGVVTKKSLNDALHVAIATTSGVDAIVSWNFKHIVKLDKIKNYNEINILHGYQRLTIISPHEVVHES
jgi:predicted nucleic acid-binding protein